MGLTWSDHLKEDALEIHDIILPLNDDGDAEVVLNGDTHIGNPVYDMTKIPMKVIEAQINFIEENENVVVFSMGDDLENVSLRPKNQIRGRGREMLMREEAELYCKLWDNIMYKIVGRVMGNHELRITRTGLDQYGLSGIPIIDDELLKANPNCILSEEERGIIVRFKVGEQKYVGYLAHGTGGSMTPDYYIKRALKNFEGLNFVALAHIHKSFSNNYPVLVPTHYKNPRRKNRWGIRTGSTVPYLAYAEKRLYDISEPTNMIMTLRGDREQIQVERLIQDRIL